MSEDVEHADELQSLLDKLEDDDVIQAIEESVEEESTEEESISKEDENVEIFKPPETTISPIDEGLVASDVRSYDNQDDDTEVSVEEVPTVGVEVSKYLDKLDDVTEEVLASCRSDRADAQGILALLRGQIDDAINNQRQPSRMWVDGLVKIIEVKANISHNAIKMIESNAKMLAATKAGTTLNQQINVGGDEKLDSILSADLGSEDEY